MSSLPSSGFLKLGGGVPISFPFTKNHPQILLHSYPCQDLKVLTLTGEAVFFIFPQETASSGRAPLSLPSNSEAVLTNTAKSAPFLCKRFSGLTKLVQNNFPMTFEIVVKSGVFG